MEKLILIKLGGSLITDKNRPYTAKPKVISRLAKEIKKALNLGFKIIVSHGSGSFGHTLASKYGTAEGIKRKKDIFGLCLVQQDAIDINRIVNKIFLENKIPCLSFVSSSFSFAENKKKGRTISKIPPKNFGAIKKLLGEVQGADVTGGMLHKVEESLRMVKQGIKVWIINGLVKDNLYKAIVSCPRSGTVIA
jgi:isopentenyl phosphate kinase